MTTSFLQMRKLRLMGWKGLTQHKVSRIRVSEGKPYWSSENTPGASVSWVLIQPLICCGNQECLRFHTLHTLDWVALSRLRNTMQPSLLITANVCMWSTLLNTFICVKILPISPHSCGVGITIIPCSQIEETISKRWSDLSNVMQLRGGRASIHTQTDWSNGGRLNDWATPLLDTAQGEDLAWGSDTWVQVSLTFWGIWLNLFKLCVLLGKSISREILRASYKIKIHDFTFEKMLRQTSALYWVGSHFLAPRKSNGRCGRFLVPLYSSSARNIEGLIQ